jgi:hypothetical protein
MVSRERGKVDVLNSNLSWYLMSALWGVGGLLAIFPAILTPMMFDAPGSTSNPITVGLAVSVAAFPLVCLAGAVLPWLLRHFSFAKWLFLLPVLDIGVIAAFAIALGYFSNGQFGGTPRSS